MEIANIEDRHLAQGRSVDQQIDEDIAAGVIRPRYVEKEGGSGSNVDRSRPGARSGRDRWSGRKEEAAAGSRVGRQVSALLERLYFADRQAFAEVVEPIRWRKGDHDVTATARVQGVCTGHVTKILFAPKLRDDRSVTGGIAE